jgi:hypothetical protein
MDMGIFQFLSNFAQFPLYGLLAYFIFLLFNGKVVSRSSHDAGMTSKDAEITRLREDRDARLKSKDDEIARLTEVHAREMERLLAEVEDWKVAWRGQTDISQSVRDQNRDLIESLYFVRRIVASLPRPADDDEMDGGATIDVPQHQPQ